MAPRPAFLSGLGGGRTTPTGLLPPSQRDKPQPRRDFTDVSGFTNMGRTPRPDFLSSLGSERPERNIMPTVPQSRDMGFLNQQIFNNRNTGIMPMTGNNKPVLVGGPSGGNIAQRVLGDRYNQAISLGYKPDELVQMVENADRFGRGINVEGVGGFGERLDRFAEFQAGNLPNMLSMSKPQVTANAPTMGEAFQDFTGGLGNFVGAVGDRLAESGPPLLQLINTGLDKLRNLEIGGQPDRPVGVERLTGFGSQELNDFNSLNRSQQNTYIMLRKNLPHAEAFRQAQNQRAIGGIATLQ